MNTVSPFGSTHIASMTVEELRSAECESISMLQPKVFGVYLRETGGRLSLSVIERLSGPYFNYVDGPTLVR